MTKEQYIERYGLEAYEQHKIQVKNYRKKRYHEEPEYRESIIAGQKEPEYRKFRNERNNARKKERYQNDPEYKNSERARLKAQHRASYVKDGRIDHIENYKLAAKDNFEGWHIHHRLELHYDGTVRFTRQSLINLNLYYNRPPSELIWLRRSEHIRIHHKGRTRT